MPTVEMVITNPFFIFSMGLLGMVAHFIKKYQEGPAQSGLTPSAEGTNILKAFVRYFFVVDVLNTIRAFIGYCGLMLVLFSLGEAGPVSALVSGITCNSFFNKAESGKI